MNLQKRLTALKRNPKGIRPTELCALLEATGFERKEGKRHTKFYYQGRKDAFLSIPRHARELDEVYVLQAIAYWERFGVL